MIRPRTLFILRLWIQTFGTFWKRGSFNHIFLNDARLVYRDDNVWRDALSIATFLRGGWSLHA